MTLDFWHWISFVFCTIFSDIFGGLAVGLCDSTGCWWSVRIEHLCGAVDLLPKSTLFKDVSNASFNPGFIIDPFVWIAIEGPPFGTSLCVWWLLRQFAVSVIKIEIYLRYTISDTWWMEIMEFLAVEMYKYCP